MPIYEYQCQTCGRISSLLILKSEDEQKISCSHCQKTNLERIMSSFAVHKTEAQRLAEFDPRAPKDDSFYKDSRNIGLSAKKRMQDLGVDLGSSLDETVEKARSGKILDDYES